MRVLAHILIFLLLQAKIANYCREIFGDMLLDVPLDSFPLEPFMDLPSPHHLKRKIIIKNKKKHHHHHHHHHHKKSQNQVNNENNLHIRESIRNFLINFNELSTTAAGLVQTFCHVHKFIHESNLISWNMKSHQSNVTYHLIQELLKNSVPYTHTSN